MDSKRRAKIVFLIALSALTIWLSYLIARPFLQPVFYALILAIVFHPLHAWIHRWIRNASLAAFLATLGVLLLIAVPATLLGAALKNELTVVYQSLREKNAVDGGIVSQLARSVDGVWQWIGRYADLSQIDLREQMIDKLQQISSFLLSRLAGAAGGVTSFLVAAIVVLFTLFYLFRDGRALWRWSAALIPLAPAELAQLTEGIHRAVRASMYGGVAVALAQGLLTALAFWFLKLPSPILWGLIAAMFSFVPLVGSAAVWLPASIVLLVGGHWGKALILIGWGAGVVGLADNVVRPYVISEQVHFHPLHVFFALLGGMQAFGFIGLFVGPVVLAMAQALFRLLREETAAHSPDASN
ncbi:MAG: AI-2E family transporter [Blastocatellia bacterium]|nr:AI-2E family transporter [Blastocatellia bacterium]